MDAKKWMPTNGCQKMDANKWMPTKWMRRGHMKSRINDFSKKKEKKVVVEPWDLASYNHWILLYLELYSKLKSKKKHFFLF